MCHDVNIMLLEHGNVFYLTHHHFLVVNLDGYTLPLLRSSLLGFVHGFPVQNCVSLQVVLLLADTVGYSIHGFQCSCSNYVLLSIRFWGGKVELNHVNCK